MRTMSKGLLKVISMCRCKSASLYGTGPPGVSVNSQVQVTWFRLVPCESQPTWLGEMNMKANTL